MKVPEMLETNRLMLRPFQKESPNEFLDSYRIPEAGFSLVISSKENELILGTCGLYQIEKGISIGCVYALLPEFEDIRGKFGYTLAWRIGRSSDTNWVKAVFNDVANEFCSIENRYGNYFNAEFLGIIYDYEGKADKILVRLVLSSENTFIEDEVEYVVW